MTLAGLLVFSLSYVLAVASPGPGIAALVGQVLGRGLRAAPAYVLGMLAGDFVWFTTAALGLAALAHTFAGLFALVKWAGVVYLLYLAWKMWAAPVAPLEAGRAALPVSHATLFMSGLTLTLGNPKTMAFFLALLPAILDLEHLSPLGFAEVALLIAIILPAVLAVYALFAHAARGFFRSARALRLLNRVSGAAIAGAAATIAARN
jgi:threonine/homoserine/homoserine lactone efflux protein